MVYNFNEEGLTLITLMILILISKDRFPILLIFQLTVDKIILHTVQWRKGNTWYALIWAFAIQVKGRLFTVIKPFTYSGPDWIMPRAYQVFSFFNAHTIEKHVRIYSMPENDTNLKSDFVNTFKKKDHNCPVQILSNKIVHNSAVNHIFFMCIILVIIHFNGIRKN